MTTRPYPLAHRALRACFHRSERAGETQARNVLAIYRHAADSFAVWRLGCLQRHCRRAGRCAGTPASGATTCPHPLPPCLDEERFRGLRDWLVETYGAPPPQPHDERPDPAGSRPAGTATGARRTATDGAGQAREAPRPWTALEILRHAVETGLGRQRFM